MTETLSPPPAAATPVCDTGKIDGAAARVMIDPMPDFDLNAFLPYRLALLAGRVSRDFAAEYGARYGLSIAEWRILAHLSQGEALSIRDLHLRADLEKSKASRAAARLVERGLVDKREGRLDRRLVELSLSEAGQAAMADLIPLALGFEAGLLAELPSEDRTALVRITDHLLTRAGTKG